MVLAILQARTSSHRLPRKVLRTILGRAMILRQLDRLKNSQAIDQIILATSLDVSDDELVSVVTKEGGRVYRGSLEDVLSRYYECAKTYRPRTVVRVTGDCPVIDWHVVDDVIRCHIRDGNDYTRTTEYFPDGLDTEVFTFDALEKSYQEAEFPSEREHVTLYIRNHPELFRIGYVDAEEDWSIERWTVDEPQDFLFIERIYELLFSKTPDFDMYDILELLREYPELRKINAGIRRDEGLLKSLQDDFYRKG